MNDLKHAVVQVSNLSKEERRLTAALIIIPFYLILWPIVSTFRFKRLLLNHYPYRYEEWRSVSHGKAAYRRYQSEKIDRIPASSSVTRSTGVYALERDVLKLLNVPAPREFPFDLMHAAILPVGGIVFFVDVIVASTRNETFALSLFIWIVYGATFILAAVLRLAWLWAAFRARIDPQQNRRSAWLLGDEIKVQLRARKTGLREVPVRRRSPLLVGWLGLTLILWPLANPVIALPIFAIAFWLWRSTARDLREVGFAYDIRRLQHIHPWVQALIAVSPAFLIVLFRAPRLVREAQQAAGLRHQVSCHLAWLAFIWPLQLIVLQRHLNRLWRHISTHPPAP